MEDAGVASHLPEGDGDARIVVYKSISIKEMEFEESDLTFYYPCPCGDLFELSLKELMKGLRIATCPSCSLQIGVVVTKADLEEIYSMDNTNAPLATVESTTN